MSRDIEPLGLPVAGSGQPDGFVSGDEIADALSARLPDLAYYISGTVTTAVICTSETMRSGPNRAVTLLVNQAVNDLQDLLLDLASGRGRPAARAARALVEHAINLRSVIASADLAERYARHAPIRDQIESEARIGIERLSGKERKAEEHRLRKLGRNSHQAADEAVADYGSSFRLNWATANLRDRAVAHGLTDLYAYYRLSSMVLHGSAGGADGTVSAAYEQPVHRTGPALSLCINAYHEGIRAFQVIAETLESTGAVAPFDALQEALNALLGAWPDYRRAIRAVDEWLWPSEAPVGSRAVLCVFRSGQRRWYWHEPRLDLFVEAHPPSELPNADMIERMIAQQLPHLDPFDPCLSIHVAGVQVSPRADRQAVPAQHFLVPRESGRLLDKPIVLTQDENGSLRPVHDES